MLLNILLCLPIVFAWLMVVPPPGKRRRTGRVEQQQVVPAKTPTETDQALLERAPPNGFFIQADLDSLWVNHLADSTTTWKERILEAITHWRLVCNVQPHFQITTHKYLKSKNAFGRTHKAVKQGMMAITVYKCIFGRLANFDYDTRTGGMLKSCTDLPLYNTHIVPLVKFLCHFFNSDDHRDGPLLNFEEVLDVNFGNWYKNIFKRAVDGIYTENAVLAVLAQHAIGMPADETCCKGLYIHWCKWCAQNIPDFYVNSKENNPLHVMTGAENTVATWDAISGDNVINGRFQP